MNNQIRSPIKSKGNSYHVEPFNLERGGGDCKRSKKQKPKSKKSDFFSLVGFERKNHKSNTHDQKQHLEF